MSSWPSWWSWTLPPSLPALSTSWGWCWPFTESHFHLPSLRYGPSPAQKGKIVDGRVMFWPTVQSKRVEIRKKKFPPRNLTLLAWWWPQKELDFGHSSQSYRASKSKVSKNDAKVPNFGADLRVGSRFGPLRNQNGSKSKKVFFPQKADLAGLMLGPKTFSFWPFWPKL